MYRTNRKWSDEAIEKELRRVSRVYGRMPTTTELQSRRLGGLSNAMNKRGRKYWMEKLGVEEKPTWERQAP